MKRSKGIVHQEQWSVSASQRVREFSGENLSVLPGKFFCNACRETQSVRNSCGMNLWYKCLGIELHTNVDNLCIGGHNYGIH